MLNFCQVSLSRDIPIILENYRSFKKIYKSFKTFVICPKNEIHFFKKKLDFTEFNLIDEDSIISFEDFSKIFEEISSSVKYQDLFRKRLRWYYQQVLKLSFAMDFINLNKEGIIIWDADTIILKKIKFFKNDHSIRYGTLFEFHKSYFETNKSIIGEHPKYFISSLIQFIGLSVSECEFFNRKINFSNKQKKTSVIIAKIILKNIFKTHENYNGSLFSEYELIGISNYMFKKDKQKALFTLRNELNGKLTGLQIMLAKFLNVKHITYEHSHLNKDSQGMLERKQKWISFIRILIKDFVKFNLRNLKHNINFYYY
jgi:hypothetical protein